MAVHLKVLGHISEEYYIIIIINQQERPNLIQLFVTIFKCLSILICSTLINWVKPSLI